VNYTVEIWLIHMGERPGDPDTFTWLTKQHGLPMVPLNDGDRHRVREAPLPVRPHRVGRWHRQVDRPLLRLPARTEDR
jgi:hypothetical protein